MESLYRSIAVIGGVLAVLHSCDPAKAQQAGQLCPASVNIETRKSLIPEEGILECIPDGSGIYSWQAMGAGIARYDTSATCNVPGTLRWNGTDIQYCDGAGWNYISGSIAALKGAGGNYHCDPGYQLVWFQGPAANNTLSYFALCQK